MPADNLFLYLFAVSGTKGRLFSSCFEVDAFIWSVCSVFGLWPVDSCGVTLHHLAIINEGERWAKNIQSHLGHTWFCPDTSTCLVWRSSRLSWEQDAAYHHGYSIFCMYYFYNSCSMNGNVHPSLLFMNTSKLFTDEQWITCFLLF